MTEHESFSHDELRVLGILRSMTDDDRALHAPPPDIWANIERAISAESERPEDESGPTGRERSVQPDVIGLDREAPATSPLSSPHKHDRFSRWVPLLATAAALVLAVIGIGVLRSGRDGSTELASAPLSAEGLPGAPARASGHADIRQKDGQRVLHLDMSDVAPRSGEYLELWLIDTDVKGMVSLGVARPGADYVLPTGLAISEYPIVDISTEPYDGNPTHSGLSLLRGQLPI